MTDKPKLTYRLRMQANKWFLWVYNGVEYVKGYGPYSYERAKRKAKKLGLVDRDRENSNGS